MMPRLRFTGKSPCTLRGWRLPPAELPAVRGEPQGAEAGAAAALPGRGGAGAAMAEAERAALPPPAESSRDGAEGELSPGMERQPEPREAAAAAVAEEEEARPASPPFFLLYPGHGGGAAAAPPGLWRPPAPRGGAELPVLVLSYPGPDGAREYHRAAPGPGAFIEAGWAAGRGSLGGPPLPERRCPERCGSRSHRRARARGSRSKAAPAPGAAGGTRLLPAVGRAGGSEGGGWGGGM